MSKVAKKTSKSDETPDQTPDPDSMQDAETEKYNTMSQNPSDIEVVQVATSGKP